MSLGASPITKSHGSTNCCPGVTLRPERNSYTPNRARAPTPDAFNEGDVRITHVVETNGTDRVTFRHGKFNYGRKEQINLKRNGNVFETDNAVTKRDELSEEENQVLSEITTARHNKLNIALTSGATDLNAKRIADRIKKNSGLKITSAQVREHMQSLLKKGHIHKDPGIRGGKNYRPATFELGPMPEPDLFNESAYLQMFNRFMGEHDSDIPIRAEHMAISIVQEIDAIAYKGEEGRQRLGWEAERVRKSEVMAWLRGAISTDLRDYAQRNDDGALVFRHPVTEAEAGVQE